jgi:predicted MFS family arabinose efflux permease
VTILTVFAMEVPTGMAADRWGRKPCLVAALALQLVGYLMLAAAATLTALLVALGVLTLGKALQSGTFEALLWESLPERDRDREYVRVFGRIHAAELIAIAGASLLGGFLYEIDDRLPFACAGAAFGVAALAALGLREPPREVGSTLDSPSAMDRGTASAPAVAFSTDLRAVSAAFARAWRLTVPLILVGVFLAVSEEVLDDVLSVEFGFSPTGLGALIAAAYVGAAIAARSAHRLERSFGRRRLVFGLALIAAVTLALSPRLGLLAGGLGVLLRHAFRAVHDTVAGGQLAAAAPPALRATTISLYQAVRRLPYVAFAWSVGAVMDRMTARGFALWFGLAMALVTAIAWRLSIDRGETPASPAASRAGAERW